MEVISLTRHIATLFLAALLAGCASIDRPDLPPAIIALANRDAFPGIRFPAANLPANAIPDDAVSEVSGKGFNVLALSGGGPDGAYGAGLLAGWTESNNRPVFDVVTGVSTGALMAPFAFLGSSRDAQLRDLYTGVHIQTILKKGSPVRLVSGPAIYKSERLKELIALNIDGPLLAAIADEHRAGRRLYVATANLDAQQMDIWDMGAIAARATPESAALFREVMLSAVSVPVAFSPELIPVDNAAEAISEAHADATVFSHIYAGPELFPNRCKAEAPRCTLYVIVHNKTLAEPATLKFKAADVIKRSVETVIKANLNTRLLATAQMAREAGVAFRLAYLDVPFAGVSPIDFNLDYMRKIYALGESAGRRPDVWLNAPPKEQ
jgi:predicted acylesterase/phospholipase RssA